jgi:uncharacterized glyoxalase superfamily protein PhnB
VTVAVTGIPQVMVFVADPPAVAGWSQVDDFDAAREALLARGCDAWRGALELEDGRRMCQLRDPFGIVWGLDGA